MSAFIISRFLASWKPIIIGAEGLAEIPQGILGGWVILRYRSQLRGKP
jgi:hypothetical protein